MSAVWHVEAKTATHSSRRKIGEAIVTSVRGPEVSQGAFVVRTGRGSGPRGAFHSGGTGLDGGWRGTGRPPARFLGSHRVHEATPAGGASPSSTGRRPPGPTTAVDSRSSTIAGPVNPAPGRR